MTPADPRADSPVDPAGDAAGPGPAQPKGNGQGPVEADAAWLSQGERGTLFGIRMVFKAATLLGRRAMRPIVCAIALWYRLFDRRAVAASKAWLTRVHGSPPSYWAIYRHLRTFAQVTLDRIFLLSNRLEGMRFRSAGDEHMRTQLDTGRGAVLLGAHLGSYQAMRTGGTNPDKRVQILGYFENARMINALFEQLNPQAAAEVVHLGEDPVGAMARVRARLEDGEMVALLGDRVGLNDRIVHASFFGQSAPFAAGPFLLASLLRCPVYLFFGLYSEPNQYELICEPFADGIALPRKSRDQALQGYVQQYAERVEHHARRNPDNWFNFFDFWRPA